MNRHVESVRDWMARHRLLPEGGSVLVGVSGGIDSIVLADVLTRLDYDLRVVHVNFRLRGEASEGDEAFVRSWCRERHLPLHVRHFDTVRRAEEGHESVQETARRLRYDVFARIASDAQVSAVAVGHHRDDQVETVLINLFRGTGPDGLAGMPVSRRLNPDVDVRLIRPLLALWRSDVEAYAREVGLTWREDASNLSPAYKRGALRRYVLPVIERRFGGAVKANVARSADLMRSYVESTLNKDLRDAFLAASSGSDVEDALDLDALQSMDEVVRRRVILEGIRRWLPGLEASSATVAQVENLLDAQTGRRLAHSTGEVWRERTRLLFRAGVSGAAEEMREWTLTADSAVQTSMGEISLHLDVQRPERLDAESRNEEFVDADRIEAPLIVRRWHAGDRFVPLGMAREKKLSDFLTDDKVPPHLKNAVLVVQSGEEIVWVVGHRIADSVRVRPDTRRVARFRFHPSENSS